MLADTTRCLLHVASEDEAQFVWLAAHRSVQRVNNTPGPVPVCVGAGGPPRLSSAPL